MGKVLVHVEKGSDFTDFVRKLAKKGVNIIFTSSINRFERVLLDGEKNCEIALSTNKEKVKRLEESEVPVFHSSDPDEVQDILKKVHS